MIKEEAIKNIIESTDICILYWVYQTKKCVFLAGNIEKLKILEKDIVDLKKLKEVVERIKEIEKIEDLKIELANIYSKIGDYFFKKESAISERAYLNCIFYLKKTSENFQNSHNLGYSYFQISEIKNNYKEKLNFLDKAETNFKKAIKLDKSNLITFERLANVYEQKSRIQSNYEKKEKLLRKGEKLLKEKIEIEMKIEIKNNEKNVSSIKNTLGVIYKEIGSLYLNKTEEYENRNNNSENYEQAKEYFEKSQRYYKEAFDGFKDDEGSLLEIAIKTNIGNIYYMFGELATKDKKNKKDYEKPEYYYKKAKDYYKNVENLNCMNPDIYNNLGAVSFKLKEFEPAKSYLENAIKLDGNNYIYYSSLAEVYKANDLEKSICNFEKALEKNPYSKENLFSLGKTLIEFLEKNDPLKIEKMKKKFIDNKCYFLINNLKNLNSLDEKIKNDLEKSIKKHLKEDLKTQSEKFNFRKLKPKKHYYMYKKLEEIVENDKKLRSVRLDRNLKENLEERKMWKSDPKGFNDPFDPYYKIYCEKNKTPLAKELKGIRISCFTEKYDNLLMWAHYGDNHKGICFGYKFEDIKPDNDTYFDKVIYEGLKTKIDEKLSLTKIDEELLTISEVYLRKHINWKYENEWRLINFKEKVDFYENVKISEVYFGMKCEENYKIEIMKIFKKNKDYKKINFFEMEENDNLTLKRKKINLNKMMNKKIN